MESKTTLYAGSEEIPLYTINKDDFFRRTTLLFGASDSGKSVLLKDIMFYLKDELTMVYVFAPTALSNNIYSGLVPEQAIKKEVLPEELDKLYKRQEMATEIYNKANNLSILESLFNMVSNNKDKMIVNKIKEVSKRHINKIENNSDLDMDVKAVKIDDIKDFMTRELIRTYKIPIKLYQDLLSNKFLSDEQSYALKYLNFNPNIGIIMDDCAASIKSWITDKKYPTLKEIFYNGRHNHITSIYTLQDDKDLDSSFRKNAFINFFCTDICATAYFTRASNSFPKPYRQKADKVISRILPIPGKNESENDETMEERRRRRTENLKNLPKPTLVDFGTEFNFDNV